MTSQAGARRLVLLRHGRTQWNAVRRAQGHTDVPLDEAGRAQAAAVAPHVAGMGPVRLWSSDLQRARQTAAYVAAATGLRVQLDERLRENDLGERAGLTPAEFEARFPDAYASWRSGDDAPDVPGAEPREDLQRRMSEVLTACLADLEPGETGVAVTHGWASKAGVFALLGWPAEGLRSLRGLDNCAWATLADTGPGDAWRLEAWNETAISGSHPPDFASDGPVG